VAANKMDMAKWDEAVYRKVVDQVNEVSARLGFTSSLVIPVSALEGDNVVEPSFVATWYQGPTVLQALEAAPAGSWASSSSGARLPIQWVLRQHGGGRTYAGMINGGEFTVGQQVTLMPQGITTTLTGINGPRGAIEIAQPGLSVDFDLSDETDAGRGDMIATAPLPKATTEFEATICWFSEKPLTDGARLRLKHTTRSTPVRVTGISGTLDVGTLEVGNATEIALNDIGLVHLATADAIVVDDYRDNRVTGSFILIDEVTNATVAAGMIGHANFL